MKLIKPSQISGEIMTLIEEADTKLILVSPYCKFSDWKKFLNTISYLKKKNIPVEFFVREGEAKTIKEVKDIGFEPLLIPNLHSKLYINEKYAIVSSMNLLTYSDMNSLDIAYKTENKQEYDELIEYYERYLLINISEAKDSRIKPVKPNTVEDFKSNSKYARLKHSSKIKEGEWQYYLIDQFDEQDIWNASISFDDSILMIQTNNRYSVNIERRGKYNHLSISGILTKVENDYLKDNLDKFCNNSDGLDVSLKKESYNIIRHDSCISLSSSDLRYMYKKDYNVVIQIILDFVSTLESLKYHCRSLKRSK